MYVAPLHVAPLLKAIIMNLEQLLFNWKGQQLVLAVFAGTRLIVDAIKNLPLVSDK